jgi:hypothetical protein
MDNSIIHSNVLSVLVIGRFIQIVLRSCPLYSYSTLLRLPGLFIDHSSLFIALCSSTSCNRMFVAFVPCKKGFFLSCLCVGCSTGSTLAIFGSIASPHNFEYFALFHSIHTLLSCSSCTSCLTGTVDMSLVEARSLFHASWASTEAFAEPSLMIDNGVCTVQRLATACT